MWKKTQLESRGRRKFSNISSSRNILGPAPICARVLRCGGSRWCSRFVIPDCPPTAPPPGRTRARREAGARKQRAAEMEGPLRPSFSSGAPPPRAVGTRAAIRGACVRVKRFCDPAVPPGGPRAALCSCRTETPFGETLGWPARRRLAGVLCCPCGELASRSAAARRSLPRDPIARSPARLKHCSGAPRGAGGAHCTAKAMICPRSAEATPARSPCALACGQLPP